MPADEVPPEIPGPALGINFSRDGMRKKDWFSLVAVHSDCWLVAVAFYFGARLIGIERAKQETIQCFGCTSPCCRLISPLKIPWSLTRSLT